MRRQLSASVLAAAQRSNAGHVDHAALPDASRPYNVLVVRLPPGGVHVTALRLHNYNKSAQDTARGVKRMVVLAGVQGGRKGGGSRREGCTLPRSLALVPHPPPPKKSSHPSPTALPMQTASRCLLPVACSCAGRQAQQPLTLGRPSL